MTDLVTILDKEFLETLELRLVRLCKDKVSVVFEDLQSKPITATPGVRIFPERKGDNICKCMIDCAQNEHAQRLCLVSDSQGATMARTHKKGCLYRCHQGRGFPNLLFPITIWPDEVVGYLYVGQFVFKRLSDDERESFIRRLNQSKYMCDDVKRFVSEWYDIDRENFWEYIIGPTLKRDPNFSKIRFSALIENQIDNYGVSPDEFFDIIELIQGLASNLSKLGNSVYLLMTLVEIERRLPPILKAEYDSALTELREAIASAVTEKGETGVDVHETVETITDKSLAILMACKNYEDEYIEELVKSYRLGVVTPTNNTKSYILQYYAKSATFEVILYSKLRTKTRSQTLVEKGDELVLSFFNTLASCGHQFQTFQQLIKELFLKMYRENNVQFLLKKRLIPCMRILFDNPADLRKWLVVNGVTDLDIAEYPEGITSLSRTFDLTVWDLESLQNQIRQINTSLSKGLTKASRIESLDVGDLNEYLQTMNDLRVKLSKNLSYDRFGTRKCLKQKAYKVFLNSGGLTTTHVAALNEQQKWLAYRNEEGPIGLQLEKELLKKIERTRDLMARYIGAENRHCIIFTHNTTSAIDLVLRGLLKPGDEILTTDLEHNVVYYLAEYYKNHYDCNTVIAEISKYLLKGKDWLSILTNEIGPKTRLIVISHVLFSTGSVLNIKDIIHKCKKASEDRRIFILVDGAHAVGNIKVNVKDLGCDFYAFDGHKWLLGPEGIGLLYSKEEYLKADNPFGIHIPLSTAFMVSPKYVPKKMNGRNYELGTMDVAKFVALAPTIEVLSKLKFRDTSRWRKRLIKKFHEGIKNTQWKILNLTEARKTGMLCLQIVGRYDRETYERIVALLEKSNISVRCLNKPKCIRVCLHHYNNETDVEIAVSHLKALLEGANVHIGQHEKIRSKLKENIKDFLKPSKSRNVTTLVGLNLFSIAGAGKNYVIDKLLKELQKTRTISSSFTIRAKDILKSKNPDREFALVLDQALKKTPAVIFIDEADSLFGEKQEAIRAIFNSEYNKIMKRKVVFITSVNNPYAIHESVASRLRLTYFPLPDFNTRLEYLRKVASKTPCSSKLLLTQLGRLTEWYSMRNLKTLWQTAKGLAKDNVLKPEHFETARQSIKRTASDKILKKYTKWIQDLKPKLLTGEIEIN